MNTDTIHYLTQDELTRLFGVVASKRDRAIFRVAYTYGLRASEIGQLTKDNLDFDQARITNPRLGDVHQPIPRSEKVVR